MKPRFTVVLVEHGYATTEYERRIILAAGGEFVDGESRPLAEVLELCEQADAVMCRRLQVTREMVRRFRRCKTIMRYGVGTDNIDVEAATQAGMIVGHVPDYSVDEVSTHAIALLLACVRNVVATHEKVSAGGWETHRLTPLWRMAGRTLGLVGLGNIGQAVARKMAGWGLRLLATDPFVEPERAEAAGVELVDSQTLWREADYVSLHVPLLPETRHLADSRALGLMKQNAILVNTSRGPVLDTQALLAGLDNGQILRAGLDVFESEPLASDSPLRGHPRIVLTDHTAWYSEESQVQLQTTAAEEVVRVCTGELPRSLANPEVLVQLGRSEEWTPTEQSRWQLRRLKWLQESGTPGH